MDYIHRSLRVMSEDELAVAETQLSQGREKGCLDMGNGHRAVVSLIMNELRDLDLFFEVICYLSGRCSPS